MTVKMSEEEYFRRAKEKRGDTDYSGSVYNGMREKMNFRCIEHDIEFNQRIDVHLSGSVGCPKCQHSFDMVAFEKDSRKKNGDNLDYSECVYIRYGHKMIFRCIKHNIKFEQRIDYHLQGCTGCSECQRENMIRTNTHCFLTEKFLNEPASLYYGRITDFDGAVYFKVGITNKDDVIKRFKKVARDHIEILWEKKYSTGRKAWNVEQSILEKYKEHRIFNQNIQVLKGCGGWTEVFGSDVLGGVLAKV